ncbi:MAG: SdrD B-like domain-containing protein [Azoarcus sp.]
MFNSPVSVLAESGLVRAFSKPFLRSNRSRRLLLALSCALLSLPTAQAAITVSKNITSGYTGTPYPGDTTAFTLTLSNDNSGSPVTDVSFTDDMSAAAIKVVRAVSNDCGGTLIAGVGSQQVSLTGGVIPVAPGASVSGTCSIVFEVNATTVGERVNTVGVGAVTGSDGSAVANTSPAQQSFTVLPLSSLTTSVLFSPDSVVQFDQVSTLRIRVNNPNSAAAVPLNSTSFTLPAGVAVAATPNASVTCTGTGAVNDGVFSPTAGASGSLTMSGGTAGQSGHCEVLVDVVGTDAGATGSNTVTLTMNGSDVSNARGLAVSGSSDSLTIVSPLRVAKSFSPASMRSGQDGSLVITLYNDGSVALNGVAFTDDPIGTPAGGSGGTLTVASGATTTCGGTLTAVAGSSGIQLSGASIPALSSCTVTVPFAATLDTASVSKVFNNTIAAGDVGNSRSVTNRPASASVTVHGQIEVAKSQSPSNPAAGGIVVYSVTLSNYSGGALAGVRFIDTLPSGVTVVPTVSPTMSGAGCSGALAHDYTDASRPAFTLDLAAGSGGSPSLCTVSFTAQVAHGTAQGQSRVNGIAAGAVCENNGAGPICNPSASNNVTLTVNHTATVAKSFSVTSLPEGGVSKLTITLSNNSQNPLTSVQVTDNLPAGMLVASPANASTTCVGGSVTATPNQDQISLSGATIPARASGGTGTAGSCAIDVNVTGAAGNYTNTIPASTLAATQQLPDGSQQPATYDLAASASITFRSALSATKHFLPSTVQPGGQSRVSIRLRNTETTGTLYKVSLSDDLPSGLTVSNPANAYSTCDGALTITATPGAGVVQLSGATLPPSSECDLVFMVDSSGSGPWVNTIPIGGITADGGVRNTAALSATLQSASGSVVVTQTISPNTIDSPGEAARLTITVLNNGALDLSGLSLTNHFTDTGLSSGTLTGLRIAANPNATTTCPGGVVTANSNETSIGLSGVSMAGGTSASCTVSVDVTTLTTGTVQNFIPIGAVSTAEGVTNADASTASLAALGRIGVEKSFSPATIAPGQRARLTLRFINPLALPLANIRVIDDLPAGMTVPAGADPVITCAGGSITTPTADQVVVSGGTLGAASGGVSTSCVAEIDVVVSAEGSYTNVINPGDVTASAGGSSVSNPPPGARATLEARTSASITKTFIPDTVRPGENTRLTITLSNPNAVALHGATLTDNLPSGLTVALTPNASTTCGGTVSAVSSATSVALAGATIPATGSCQVQVDAVSNVPGVYTNTIPANALNTEEGVRNEDPASAQVTVSVPPVVTKQFSPASIPSGATSTLSIFLGNENASALTLSKVFQDDLPTAPGSLVIASPNGLSSTCTGTVTAAAGSGQVSLASGAQIPAGGCRISVNVTGTVEGSYNNYIPASALSTNLGDNRDPAAATLEISPLGYVSGRVFLDKNVTPNGLFDGSDTGLAGVTLTLSGVETVGGAVISRTTTSDALGNYAFTGLNAGTYTVTQPVQPTGTLNGMTTAGTVSGGGGSPGAATPVTTATSAIANIILNESGGSVASSPNNNFAEVPTSTISGSVFLDQNNNGVQNGADAGISAQTIRLTGTDNNGNAVTVDTTTDASGNYTFSGLAPGTYAVTQLAQPADTANGQTVPGAVGNGGSAGSATAPTTVTSQIAGIVLPPATVSAANNFAELPNGRSIRGQVFLDYAGNGAVDGSDYGIGAQVINLSGTDASGNPVTRTTTSLADGSFEFSGLPEGTYTIDQPVQPPSTTNGTPVVGSAGGVASNNPTGGVSSRISGIAMTGTTMVSGGNLFPEVPGAAPDLAISKTHTPATFAAGGTSGYYTLVPSNVGSVASSGLITMVDTLPAGITPVAMPTTGSWTCSAAGQRVTCTSSTVIAAATVGDAIVLRVAVASGLAGQILTNQAVISGGGEPAGFEGNNTATDPTPIADAASVTGKVWRDLNHDRVLDSGEPVAEGWMVELVLSGVQVGSTTTAADGSYGFTGLAPGPDYQIRFREPTTGVVFGRPVPNERGLSFTNGAWDASANPAGASNADGTLSGLTLASGTNTVEQSLPLDPQGVVYDAVTRQPVQGAVVTLTGPGAFDPAIHLLGGSATQTTGADGIYQFLLLAGAPAGNYTLSVTVPPGYVPGTSTLIPACTNVPSVGAAPAPALVAVSNTAPAAGTALHDPVACEASISATATTTQYYLGFVLTPGTSANVLNNHIPLDPILGGAIRITKTTPLVSVSKGGLVPYTITATNTLSAALGNIDVVDQVPPGFKYRSGSASVRQGGSSAFVAAEPVANGRALNWAAQSFAAGETKTYRLVLVIGAGVGEGEYTNLAWALNNIVSERVSNIGSAVVRVIPDPVFDCSDIIGKVFDDKNANGYQDDGEPGIPNVRVVTARGLLVTADAEGRFHVTCADIPQQDRGSNFVMKLDERTLPSGYRLTTENPRDVRTTRGKMVKLNFGATVHKVFRIEVDARAFTANDSLAPEWVGQLRALLPQLALQPAVARLAYRLGDAAEADLAEQRLAAMGAQLKDFYQQAEETDGKDGESDRPPLMVETEIIGASVRSQGAQQ